MPTFTPDRILKAIYGVFSPAELVTLWDEADSSGSDRLAGLYLHVLSLHAPRQVLAEGRLAVELAAVHRDRGEMLSAAQYEEMAREEVDVGETRER